MPVNLTPIPIPVLIPIDMTGALFVACAVVVAFSFILVMTEVFIFRKEMDIQEDENNAD
jgi:hypothetical protein